MNEAAGLVNLTDRKKIELTGILSLDSFDEYSVTVTVSSGKLIAEGEGISITELDLERGIVCATGMFNAVTYSDKADSSDKGLMARLFGGRKQ